MAIVACNGTVVWCTGNFAVERKVVEQTRHHCLGCGSKDPKHVEGRMRLKLNDPQVFLMLEALRADPSCIDYEAITFGDEVMCMGCGSKDRTHCDQKQKELVIVDADQWADMNKLLHDPRYRSDSAVEYYHDKYRLAHVCY